MIEELPVRGRGRPAGEGPRQQEAMRIAEAMAASIIIAVDALRAELTALPASVELQMKGVVEQALGAANTSPNSLEKGSDPVGKGAELQALMALAREILAEIHLGQRDGYTAGQALSNRLARLEQGIGELTAKTAAGLEDEVVRAEKWRRELLADLRTAMSAEVDRACARTEDALSTLPSTDAITLAVVTAVKEADDRAAQRHDELLRAIRSLAPSAGAQAESDLVYVAVAKSLTAALPKLGEVLTILRPPKPAQAVQLPSPSRDAVKSLLASGLQVIRARTQTSHPVQFPIAEYALNGEVRVEEHADGRSRVFLGKRNIGTGSGMLPPGWGEVARAAIVAVQRHKERDVNPLEGKPTAG